MNNHRSIAYFSMEIGLLSAMPTYSGGLGILAGDTLLAAADMNIPMVGITLLHRKGYLFQRLNADGQQIETPFEWGISDFLVSLHHQIQVTIEDRVVHVGVWQYEIRGCGDYTVPIFFLDTDLTINHECDRQLTHYLYGGDAYYRLCQEIVLGIGGVRMLRQLGFVNLKRFHMNEGHAAFLSLELLHERTNDSQRQINQDDIEEVRQLCVFTTHTPVPAGQDKFPLDLAQRVLGPRAEFKMKEVFCCDNVLNMTFLALNLSHYINGVAKRHGDISRHMFANYQIDSITNGVHAATWASPHFQRLFDRYITGWREDNFSLRYGISMPADEIWSAHSAAKNDLIAYLNRTQNSGMKLNCLTIGYARRATAYKRMNLIFQDMSRLRRLAGLYGGLQIIFAGKAHPKDNEGKELIRQVFTARAALGQDIRIVYLENYDIDMARLMVAGVDLWLNTPMPPLEASGTSGMKAAINGVPSLSILDGWWIEGCIEGITGWAIGDDPGTQKNLDISFHDAESLYDKLEHVIMPLYYLEINRFIEVMRHALAINGSFFNTHRMIQQYATKAYSFIP